MRWLFELTDEQLESTPRFVREWTERAVAIGPGDRDEFEFHARAVIDSLGFPQARNVEWCGSPKSMADRMKVHSKTNTHAIDDFELFGPDRIEAVNAATASRASFELRRLIDGPLSSLLLPLERVVKPLRDRGVKPVFSLLDHSSNLPRWAFLRDHTALSLPTVWRHTTAVEGAALNCAAWHVSPAGLWACEHPVELHTEPAPRATRNLPLRRLHNAEGPALVWPDGTREWFLHGISVSEPTVTGDFTAKEMLKMRNVEVRRTMFDIAAEKRGPRWLIDELKAKAVEVDVRVDRWWLGAPSGAVATLWDFGNLKDDDGEHCLMVELMNGSLEPDGSRKSYLLRVPPDVRSAREGVAALNFPRLDVAVPRRDDVVAMFGENAERYFEIGRS